MCCSRTRLPDWERKPLFVRCAHSIFVLRLSLHYYLIIMYWDLKRAVMCFIFGVFLHRIPLTEFLLAAIFIFVDIGNFTERHIESKLGDENYARTFLVLWEPRDIYIFKSPKRNSFKVFYLSLKSILSIHHQRHSFVLDVAAAYDATSSVVAVFGVATDLLLLLNLYCTSNGSVRVFARTRWIFSLLTKIVFRCVGAILFVYLNSKWRRKFIRHAKLFIHWHGTIKHDSLRVVRLVVELAPSLACARRQSSIYTTVGSVVSI